MPRSFLIKNRRYKSECFFGGQLMTTDNGVYRGKENTMDIMFPTICKASSVEVDTRYLQPKVYHCYTLGTNVAIDNSPLHGVRLGYFVANAANVITHATRICHDEETPQEDTDDVTSARCDVIATLAAKTDDLFSCSDCGKQYSTSSNLARHRQTHRRTDDKKARKCPHCDKVYVSMPAYSMHVRTHAQGCACAFCGKRFSRPWLLQGHIRTHTGEKPFRCPQCTKAFADKSNLRAHIQTHSAEKPYMCGRCGKAFTLKSYLYKHEESSCMRSQRYQRLDDEQ